MGIIRKRRNKLQKLDLKVNLIQAKDLVMSDPKSCIMVAGVALNGQSKKTPKVKSTASPIWNTVLKLKLSGFGVSSSVLYIAVFDKHRKYSVYLGELRVSIIDLFQDKQTGTLRSKVPPKWYKLYSSKSQNAFVVGSIMVGFDLVSKNDAIDGFKSWKDTVITKEKSVELNEQNFYSDSETDVESLILDDPVEDDLVKRQNLLSLQGSSSSTFTRSNSSTLLPPTPFTHHSNDTYDSSEVSQSDFSTSNDRTGRFPLTKKFTKFVEPIHGVVYLDIISATGLPPFKTFIKKGFDMDPFVVISFGKKTFRTQWRKHTLSPVFNASLAFEVLRKEQNYDLLFNILDKDHISFHDKVAVGSVKISEVFSKSEFVENDLKLKLHKVSDYEPHLKFKIKYKHYDDLKKEFWTTALSKFGEGGSLDIIQLNSFLEFSGLDEDIVTFFTANNETIEDTLSFEQIQKVFQDRQLKLDRCPICGKRKQTDIITHVAVCTAKGNRLKSFATAGLASKRWYSKVLIKFAYGKYALGKNNANILVQDRLTGFIIEEKMSLYIRLGIRLLYKGKGADSKRIKNLMKSLSIKQGGKFDSVTSAKDIDPFIKFHQLDLSECEEADYKTFNEFFYRKLKAGSRPPESDDPRVIVSAADSRCTTFSDVISAKEVWIKGRSFSIKKLLGDFYDPSFENCSLAIFRLAPQDYHRFHSPVDGIIGEPLYIQGEYYTVNPMAIRSELDVFGENVRVVIPIETKEFGLVFFVAVGAMMVGSTVLTVSKGDKVKRTDELGYFKFGGSTIVTLFQKGSMVFDADLLDNSSESIETLVRVGMAVGHRGDIPGFTRMKTSFSEKSDESKLKIIRTITGGNADHPWEYYNLNVDSDEELDESESDYSSEDESS